MNMFNPFKSERLELKNISHNRNAWPRNAYENDGFYQYALSYHSLPFDMMHEHYFAYTCYHKMTGEFIGYIQGYLPSVKKSLWIQTFLVDRKFLRQGYGSEFYKAVLQVLHYYVSYDKVYLACFEANKHGKIFWEKLNFEKAVETTKYSRIHNLNQLSKIFIYECAEHCLQKEFIYEQENIKNIRIQ